MTEPVMRTRYDIEYKRYMCVSARDLEVQRLKRWSDFHPEEFCHRCGKRNVSWWVDSSIWNPVMRPAGVYLRDGEWEIICPPCFIELAAEYGFTGWTLRHDHGSWELVWLAAAPVITEAMVTKADVAHILARSSGKTPYECIRAALLAALTPEGGKP